MRFAPKKFDKVVLFFFAAFSIGAFLFWVFEEQFDEKEWHARPSRRYKMVDDMIGDDELLIGRSKQEIIDFLGKPVDPITAEKDVLNYKIGTPPSFSKLKREELIIEFENDIAVKAFRVRMED
ncbi:hypothetical protein [Psychroserpens sp. Hel_I_66]|uniref:hypothetical protein n=1 Tax=Psychroserpens sp. Hel_I_66 TaxID=1250004 RepID=UPI0006462E65|nr:hypothetical protein [Psychroserpens sp. Hel_I_66]